MPAYSKELFGTSEHVVHLVCHSTVFGFLLNFLNDGSEARDKYCWGELEQIVEIADRYQFDSVPDLVSRAAVRRLRRDSGSPAFSIFKFAAQNDQLDLARLAISYFGVSDHFEGVRDTRGIACQEFHGIPGEYTAAFFQAAALCKPDQTLWDQDWKYISQNFDPDEEL
jgi:hypothetical protein